MAACLLATTFALCIYPLADTDFWWHLRTGQLIWERGEIPRTDWYLFTDSDRPWIDLHWGFQLLITALYSLGGANLVILVKAAVYCATVALAWFATGRELPTWLRAVIWIPAIICITGRSNERPEMLTVLFLSVWLWIAFRAETQLRWMWALPIVQIAWINFHALFILGLIVGGCFAVDHVIRKIAQGRWGLEPVPAACSTQAVFGVGLLSALAALINPYFLDGAAFPLVLFRKFSAEREIYATVGEFQRPVNFFLKNGFSNIYLDAEIVLAVMAIGSFLALFVWGRRWSPFRLLLFSGFLYLAWQASRNTNIFSLVAATMMTANLAELWKLWPELADGEPESPKIKSAGQRREQLPPLRAPGMRFSPQSLRQGNLAVCALFVGWLALAVTGVWGRFAGEKNVFGFGERPWWFGHEAMKFAGQPGFPDRAIAAHIGLAATYIYHNGPSHKVFLDPRLEVASPETYQLQERMLAQMQQGDRRWENLVQDREGNLPVVILDSRTSRPAIQGLFLTPGWRLVYADPAAAVFLTVPQAEKLNLEPADISPLKYPP